MTEQDLIATQLKALTIFDANNTMFSVKECAAFLGVHPNTVVNRINSVAIVAVQQDGKYHIPKLQFVDKLVKQFLTKTNATQLPTDQEKLAQGIETYFKEKLFITSK
jgi:hypothetical protein